MWPLIKRELDQMVTTTLRSSAKFYTVFTLISILVIWLLGPTMLGFLNTQSINLFILLFVMIVAGLLYTQFSLEEDASNRQMTLLQVLPISKRQMVHAKFISHLLVAVAAFIWTSILIAVNLFINSMWTIDGLLYATCLTSMLFMLIALNVLWFFMFGDHYGFIFSYVNFLVWTILLFIVVGPIVDSSAMSFGNVSIILLIGSFATFLLSWGFSIRIVRKKGIPKETKTYPAIDEQIEDLKKRYEARKGEL